MQFLDESLNPEYVARWLAVTRGYFCTDLDVLLRPTLVRRLTGWTDETAQIFSLSAVPPGPPLSP